jgi:hypothetical protein
MWCLQVAQARQEAVQACTQQQEAEAATQAAQAAVAAAEADAEAARQEAAETGARVVEMMQRVQVGGQFDTCWVESGLPEAGKSL